MFPLYLVLILYIFSTYNKQWAEAESALMDLLQQEMPAEQPKPERVSAINMGLVARKPAFGGFVNNTGADQPAHPHSLISAFVICFLVSIISKLATSEISIF